MPVLINGICWKPVWQVSDPSGCYLDMNDIPLRFQVIHEIPKINISFGVRRLNSSLLMVSVGNLLNRFPLFGKCETQVAVIWT